MTSESKAVVEVSKKCSETAAELRSELNKLRRDPGGGLRQSLGRSLRAIRRKQFLAERQEKLEKYQRILDTRILSKLDVHAIQQSGKLQSLDQTVKDLVFKLSQGFSTVEQLLTNQTLEVRQHIDRRFNEQVHEEALQRAEQRFKDSLFFPEMFARQDDIPKSHEGTCHWIFGPNYPESQRGSESNSESNSDVESLAESTRGQPWSDFTDWLETGEDVYW